MDLQYEVEESRVTPLPCGAFAVRCNRGVVNRADKELHFHCCNWRCDGEWFYWSNTGGDKSDRAYYV